jgi:hypothetical protein
MDDLTVPETRRLLEVALPLSERSARKLLAWSYWRRRKCYRARLCHYRHRKWPEKAEIRASPAVQADESGWREDGINGYIWSVSTPTIRYDEYHHSRSGEVVKQLIGENFQGVLGSDFYAGYTIHQGLHQRCGVHFLRDVHDLKDDFPQDEALRLWAKDVKAVYEQAVTWAGQQLDPSLSPRQLDRVRISFASRMPTRPPRNTPYANGSNSFYPNSLSSWLYLGFLPTTTSQNAVSALRLSLARSAVARAVPKAQRLAWAWLSVRNLDGATSQSFPPVPCPADLSIFFGSTLNRIQQDSSLRCGCQYVE